jgi:hypothetical protein
MICRAAARPTDALDKRRGEKTEVESLDHLVRLQQQRRWDHQAKRLGSLEIQHKLELRGLLHREISWLCAFEYLSTRLAA